MIRKITLLAAVAASSLSFAKAQDSTSTPLQISGSVDTYFKYDFQKRSDNILTSFATDHNSVSLGMVDIALKKTTGKASFVGEIAFGPRGQYQSIVPGDGNPANGDNSFHIQNLNVNYAFTDKFSMAAGYFGTYIGYEVISPVGNYNYSTSYLFTNGPFQNAGVKATVAFSPKASLMVGAFNDSWNVYTATPKFGVSTFGAQLMVAPVEGWSAYLNVATGYVSGTIYDLTTSYQVSKTFKVGVNAADWSAGSGAADDTGFSGGALYLQNAFTDGFGLGVRGEYFMTKKKGGVAVGPAADQSVFGLTVSGNLKSGGLTFIPEVRFDNGSANQFHKEKGALTKSASQMSLAVVYAF